MTNLQQTGDSTHPDAHADAHDAPTPAIAGQLLILKLGGAQLTSPELAPRVRALVAAGARVVIVHGGGPQVTEALNKSGLQAKFVQGLRVTDEATWAVAEPVFVMTGKHLALRLSKAGVPAVALSGHDANVLQAEVKDPQLGRVGTVTKVADDILRHLAFNGLVPIIGPVAAAAAGGTLNVNADEVAAAVATAMGQCGLVLVTDVPAVRDSTGAALDVLDPAAATRLIDSGVAQGGMVPKLHGALSALAAGVARVHIVDLDGLARWAAGETAGTTVEMP